MVPTIDGKKRWIFTAVKGVISGALIYWILRDTNLGEVFTAVRSANMPLLLLAISLDSVGYCLGAYRWRLLLKAQGVHASIHFVLTSSIVGIFFNNILPSTVGGDAVRAYDCWRLGMNKASAAAVVFVDRFLGLVALMLFVFYTLVAFNKLIANLPLSYLWIDLGAAGMLAGMFLVVWMIFIPPQRILTLIANIRLPFSQKLQNVLNKIVNGFLAFRGRKDTLATALGLSVILQINVVLQYYLIAKAFAFPISLHVFFLIIPLAIFIMMIPVSINAIGIRENVLAFFFGMFGVSKPEAIAFAWLLYGIAIFWGVLGGIVYVFRKGACLSEDAKRSP
jgi:uncharacterized protein (TIRG00374 family)